MKRVQLFEFEDFSWFPDSFRNAMTNVIVLLSKLMGAPKVIANHLKPLLKKHQLDTIVDLGTGSGGSMPEVIEIINQTQHATLILTDLHPNKKTIQRFKSNSFVHYEENSVNAKNLDKAPKGLKTMINCFHHMPPAVAKDILKSSSENGEVMLIHEMTENKIPLLMWWVFLPLSLVIVFIMCLILIPFTKGLTITHIIFTYLIPIIPLAYAWDGQASMPRIYTFTDIDEMLKGIENPNYEWTKGISKDEKGKNKGIYIIGQPKR